MSRFILYTSLVLIFCGCKKEPSPTKSGTNTLYYKVDGVAHNIHGAGGMLSAQGVKVHMRKYVNTEPYITLDSYNREDDYIYDDLTFHVSASVPELNKPYPIVTVNNNERQSDYKDKYGEHYADSTRSTITFTRYDSDVIAGKFEFYSTDPVPIRISHGWFDVEVEK